MGRIYMDLSEENHQKFKEKAKQQKRTLKGFLEYIISSYLLEYPNLKEGKGVKKDHGKK